MDFATPTSWADALAAKAERPDSVAIAGGTDVMVELNFDRRRPPALLDLTRVPELTEWSPLDGGVRVGAGVTFARVMSELADAAPGLAMASRTVGSPQIRSRGTLGGQPRIGIARGRCAPRPASRRRGGRGGVGPRHADHPDRQLLHRRQAQRSGARRADRGGPPAAM
jgi:CO/xanthine dehydrogenase FAD-binding subunit